MLHQIFIACAVLGGTLLAFQLVLSLFGFGGHDDVGGGHDLHLDHHGGDSGAHHGGGGAAWLLGFITFRNMVAGLTFFGLIGLATTSAGWDRPESLAAAAGAGLVAAAVVGVIMRSITRLEASGNVDIRKAVGQTGTVYVTIPGNKTGPGKVHLELQNRTAEYEAVTFQPDALATGAKIVVVDVVAPDTLEVIAAPQYGRMTSHA